MVRQINRKNQTKLVEKLHFPNKFSLRHYNLTTIKTSHLQPNCMSLTKKPHNMHVSFSNQALFILYVKSKSSLVKWLSDTGVHQEERRNETSGVSTTWLSVIVRQDELGPRDLRHCQQPAIVCTVIIPNQYKNDFK